MVQYIKLRAYKQKTPSDRVATIHEGVPLLQLPPAFSGLFPLRGRSIRPHLVTPGDGALLRPSARYCSAPVLSRQAGNSGEVCIAVLPWRHGYSPCGIGRMRRPRWPLSRRTPPTGLVIDFPSPRSIALVYRWVSVCAFSPGCTTFLAGNTVG